MQEETDPCYETGYAAAFATIDVDVNLTLPGCWLSFYDLIDISDKGDCHHSADSLIEGVFSKSFAPENFSDKSGSYGMNTCNGANETEAPSITDIIDAVDPTTDEY